MGEASYVSAMSEALAIALDFVRAIEARQPGEAIARFFHSDALQVEHPNRIAPNGATRDVAAMIAGIERGRANLSAQRYGVVSALADGDKVALEMTWEGDLAVALGPLAAGATLRAAIAMFITVRDGRIARVVNYDCYPPF